jgi:hypothetical protein
MAALNVPMRVVLGLPFPTPLSGRLMLVHHTGRRTGRRYRQPVSYIADGATLLTPGGGRWTNNLRDGQSVRLHLREVWVQSAATASLGTPRRPVGAAPPARP